MYEGRPGVMTISSLKFKSTSVKVCQWSLKVEFCFTSSSSVTKICICKKKIWSRDKVE